MKNFVKHEINIWFYLNKNLHFQIFFKHPALTGAAKRVIIGD